MTAPPDDTTTDLHAVIAELRAERDAALAREAATAEVLQIINSSPGDLTPVFDAILEKAHSLCGAFLGGLWTYDGELFRALATRGYPEHMVEMIRGPIRGTVFHQRLVRGERYVHVPDVLAEVSALNDPVVKASTEAGNRTFLAVPLRKNGTLLGHISAARAEVRPFSENEIALLRNFAAQAVIAMENARLLDELRQRTGDLQEALEYQTATSDVLKVISGSGFELEPVFQTVVDTAVRLCHADQAGIFRLEGDSFRWVAGTGLLPEFERRVRTAIIRPGTGTLIGRVALQGRPVQIVDEWADPLYQSQEMARIGGVHTSLGVPLVRDGVTIGAIGMARLRIEPFTDRQIELVSTFADQAVIAIENARLLTEQREALEQQTATAEVLRVINSSPGDLAPVFDAMLDKAMRLCGAAFGSLYTYDGERFLSAAQRGVPPAYAAFRARHPPMQAKGGGVAALVETRKPVHILDTAEHELYRAGQPGVRAMVDLGGVRTSLIVPLLKDDALLGFISVYRQEVRPFSDKDIALLENFAAQAVVAMENARLLNEQREALEQQAATAEVLQVINSSPGDLTPVFEAILEKAHALCGVTHGALVLREGEIFRAVATHSYAAEFADQLRRGYRGLDNEIARSLIEGVPFLHIPDLAQIDDPMVHASVEVGGVRTGVFVPLRRDNQLLGLISSCRREVRPFSDKEIALLQNFAAQAVIAIGNARLLTEQREALEQQTATAEVLQVINTSPGELAPVFDAMLEKARRLCEAAIGFLWTWDGEAVHRLAFQGIPVELMESLRQPFKPKPGSIPERIIAGENVVSEADLLEMPDTPHRWPVLTRLRARSFVGVALRKDDILLGGITIYRQEPRPFTDKQIALLQNFAAQAVVAMENARLLIEQREALEQQTATAEVLQVINTSPGDLAPVFDAMLEKALRLCDAAFGNLWTYDGEVGRLAAIYGASPEYRAELMRMGPQKPEPGNSLMRLVEGERLVYIADIAAEGAHRSTAAVRRMLADRAGARTVLWVPMRKDGALLGFFTIYRQEVRPFSDKQIALLENFAAQAVIAMENARLLTEQREALEQQTATAEVLQVINSSPGNLTPVFDAILDKAHRACGASVGSLVTYDGELFRVVVARGYPEQVREILRQPLRDFSLTQGLSNGERLIHIADIRVAEFGSDDHISRALIEHTDVRTRLFVPFRKDGNLLGYISAYRREVRPFSEKEIALLENFAAQAVIAMENARLLNEVRQRQEELRITFDNMGDGVAMFDEAPRLVAWNRKFQELLDVSDAILAERRTYADYIRYLTSRGEYGADADIEIQLRRFQERMREHYVFERTRPDGRVIEVRHNPVPGGGFVVIYSDITERKRSEEEIRAARDAAETALRELRTAQANLIQAEKMASLGQLTAGIAHEIKNPLNFVNNFAELSVDLLGELKDAIAPAEPVLTEKQRAEVEDVSALLTSNLEKISEHGKRADGIVKAMLEHSRGSSGERRMVDLNTLVDEALNLAYHGARAQDQSFNITLERDFAEGIAPIELAPQDMTRVFLNLFSNGFYAARQRQQTEETAGFQPTLKVTTRELGHSVEIRVRDNGSGIPTEIKDQLFQPFFTTKPTGEGTGLGLSISYDIIVNQHRGQVTVDSRANEFTDFVVTLPRELTVNGGKGG